MRFILLLVFWANCAFAADRVFNFRLLSEPETLDWNKAHTPMETYILVNLMEGLVRLNEKLQPIPALAQSWKVSPDGKVYTFKIRPGVKWSDGVTLKAQDFVYSWKRVLTRQTAAPNAYFLFDIEGAKTFHQGELKDFSQVGIHALDDLTLQIKLSQPVAHWIHIPSYWVTFPLREDVVAKNGSAWTAPGKMVTLGPYTLASHELESKIVMKANTNYYGHRGNIDQAVGVIVADDTTALHLYDSGKLDFVSDLPFLDLEKLQTRKDLKTFPYLKTVYLGFVVSKKPNDNLHLRKAISLGINRTKFGDLLHGGQQQASSFVPAPLQGYSKNLGISYQLKQAEAELKAAQIDLSQPIDMVMLNWGKTLMVGQFIQQELKKNLGLNINLQPFDNKAFRTQIDMKNYPQFLLSWSADFPDPDNFLSLFLSDSGNNRSGWKNQEYDQKVLAARYERNPKKRLQTYTEAQKILLEKDVVILPLYYEPIKALVNSRASEVHLNALNYLDLRDTILK